MPKLQVEVKKSLEREINNLTIKEIKVFDGNLNIKSKNKKLINQLV